uniref:ABC1 atypical kinase-like domain-containing protein n=1 Tax=Oryza nivara TaxID=4536 RepID=A0A0E0I2A5_ORYNI
MTIPTLPRRTMTPQRTHSQQEDDSSPPTYPSEEHPGGRRRVADRAGSGSEPPPPLSLSWARRSRGGRGRWSPAAAGRVVWSVAAAGARPPGEVFFFFSPMLRLVGIGERLLAVGTNRRAAYFSQPSHRSGYYTAARDNGLSAKRKIPTVFSRMFSHYKVIVRKNKAGDHKCRNRISRGFRTFSGTVANSSATQHAQLAWKRLSHTYMYSGPRFPLISRAACALSFSFTRFHVVPGVMALAFGKFALSRPVLADSPHLPTMEGIVTNARDTRQFLSSIVWSIWEGVTLLIRAVHLAILFFPATALSPFADTFSVGFRRRWLRLVRRTLEIAGPAFIKWGQWAATRPDLFPSDLCVELAKLHSAAPAHGFAYSKATIEKAFGRKLSEIFETFEEEPVASGSIAQVHRATLRDLHTEKHVAVKTFENGESVSRFMDEIEGNARMKRDLAHIGTYAFLKMLLEDNFIHADMHPGNILVRLNERKPKRKLFFRPKPHIVFLDVGMTAELTRDDRDNLQQFFKAVATRDGRTAANCTLQLSKQQSCPNPVAFIEELDKTFSFWGTPEGDIFHPVECMHQLLDTVRRHKVNIDGNICTVMVTILVLEGWQRKLDPGFDIMHTLKTLLLDKDIKQPVDFFS